MKKNRLILLSSLILLLAGVATALLIEREPTPLEFKAETGVSIISPPIALPDVSLVDQNGKPFNMDRIKDRWSLFFFGYTHCPDVCPTTLANMNKVAKTAGNSDINYVFVSLDPQRDTPEKLKQYVHHFNPNFIALSGDKENINRLAEAVGVIYEIDGDNSSDNYTVNHYAAILMMDPQGRLRAHILPPHSTSKMVGVVQKIREYYGE